MLEKKNNSQHSKTGAMIDAFSSDKDLTNYIEQDAIDKLKEIARFNGLGKYRVPAWFKILNINENNLMPVITDEEIKQNEFYNQVILDVNRASCHFPSEMEEETRANYLKSLTKVIISILIRNHGLYYYQGFHDVCLTILLLTDERKAFLLIDSITNLHLKYFMEKTMTKTGEVLHLITYLVKKEDPKLYEYLKRSNVGVIFSLSWVITWFSHVLNDRELIHRLFDLFIASDYLMPVYLSAAILLYKKEGIMQVECDMPSIHSYLSALPKQSSELPFKKLIKNSLKLVKIYPSETIIDDAVKEWRKEESLMNRITHYVKHVATESSITQYVIPISVTICLVSIVIYKYHSFTKYAESLD